MEGREGRPPMESLLQGLNREQRIVLAEKVINKYEDMLKSSREIAEGRSQTPIVEGSSPTTKDLYIAARSAADDVSRVWYEWIKKELLQFNAEDTREALRRLGLFVEEWEK